MEKMKVIFLDVDGVLNSEHWYHKNHEKHPERCRVETAIDPRYVRNLSKIVKLTGAVIVLTGTCRSAVRENKKHYLRQIFERYGLKVYGYTLRISDGVRGHEIQDWLDRYKDYVTNIVIIDNNDDMLHLSKYLVQTKNGPYINKKDGSIKRDTSPFGWLREGLNFKATLQAIRMLYRPYVNIYATKQKIYRKSF